LLKLTCGQEVTLELAGLEEPGARI
jgi:hypothetical protein